MSTTTAPGAFAGRWKTATSLAPIFLLLTACSGGPEQREATHMARGKNDVANHDLRAAVVEYKVASQNMPQDAEPVYQLGMIYLNAGATKPAVEAFEKAISLNPNHAGAQLQLALVKVASGRLNVVQEAKDDLSTLLAAHPGDPETMAPLALAEAKLGNKAEAWKLLEAVEQKNPSNMRPAAMIVGFYTAKGDVETAKQIARDLCERLPNSPDAAVLRGQVSFAMQDFSDADAQIDRALALKSDFLPALQLRLRRELMNQNRAAAEETTKELSKLTDKGAWSSYARMLFAEGKVDQGSAEFNRVLREHDDDPLLRDQYSYLLMGAHRGSEARAILDGTLRKDPNEKDALLQRATLEIDEGNLEAAAKDTKTLRDLKAPSGELCFQESRIYAARGQSSRQGDLLIEALRYNPRLLKARTELARLLTISGQAKNALATLDQASPFEKKTAVYLYFENMALISDGDLVEARKGVDIGLAAARSPEFLQQDAVLRIKAHDLPGARKSLDSAFQLSPANPVTVQLLGQVMKQQNEGPRFVAIVRDAAAKNPQSASLQSVLGTELLLQGDANGARAAFEAAKAAGSVVDAENQLAELDLRTGAIDQAKQRLLNLIKTHDNAPSRFLLAQIETLKGSPTDTIAAQYLKVLDMEPSNALAMNNLANVLSSSPNKYDDALFWAKKALGLVPTNLSPAIDDTIGWIYFKQGKYDDALPYLEKSLRGLDRPLAHYHLAAAWLKAGDPTRGRREYELALKQDPKNVARADVGPLFESR